MNTNRHESECQEAPVPWLTWHELKVQKTKEPWFVPFSACVKNALSLWKAIRVHSCPFVVLISLILFLTRMKGAATLHGNAEVIDEPSLSDGIRRALFTSQ